MNVSHQTYFPTESVVALPVDPPGLRSVVPPASEALEDDKKSFYYISNLFMVVNYFIRKQQNT